VRLRPRRLHVCESGERPPFGGGGGGGPRQRYLSRSLFLLLYGFADKSCTIGSSFCTPGWGAGGPPWKALILSCPF